jgi:hypothetical protein
MPDHSPGDKPPGYEPDVKQATRPRRSKRRVECANAWHRIRLRRSHRKQNARHALAPRRSGIVEEGLIDAALTRPAHRHEHLSIGQNARELKLPFLGAAHPMSALWVRLEPPCIETGDISPSPTLLAACAHSLLQRTA